MDQISNPALPSSQVWTGRREDHRLLTGRGAYVADVIADQVCYISFLRSPYAHAVIRRIDVTPALQMPGVVAILTAADLLADGVQDFTIPIRMPLGDGHATETHRSLLVRDRVRFLGEPVAMIVAETQAAAADAADAIEIDYEGLDAVVTAAQAMQGNAPLVWDDRPGNRVFHWQKGSRAAIQQALDQSHHVTRLTSRVSRVSAMPMEPRGAMGSVDAAGRVSLQVGHQSPHQLRNAIATMFKLDRRAFHVIAGDVGGSFGMKSGLLREEALVFWAARRLQRSVKWIATRSEAFLSDEQARDVDVESELGLDRDGNFTALRVSYHVNVGAYFSGRSGSPVSNFGGIAGVYRTPVIFGEAIGWFTHTPPTAPYRGAGRPDATYAIERIIDAAAFELGIDPLDLRRRNLVPAVAMPYQTPFVFKYDCGDFGAVLERAALMADYAGFPARQAESSRRGMLRGIGIANPIEVAAGPFAKPGTDHAALAVSTDGDVTLFSGAMSVGQGLETALPMLVAERLGIPPDRITYVQGDTDRLADGKGSGGSAALTLCGSAIIAGIGDLLQRGRTLIATEFAIPADDIHYADGYFRFDGSNLVLSLAEAADLALRTDPAGLTGSGSFTISQPTYPNGCHICEVEIDPETGLVRVLSYVGVEDLGHVVNAVLVDGQIHGGVAQGIGQALKELIVHDTDTAQLVSGSFTDYAMPLAMDIPCVTTATVNVPTSLNPLGVKGVGEAGTVGALAATCNAICNALAPLGIRHLDMPASPMRVWEAIVAARAIPSC